MTLTMSWSSSLTSLVVTCLVREEYSGVVHRGGGVDFDQPDAVVGVHHEVIAIQFVAVFAVFDAVECAFHALLDDFFNLGVYFLDVGRVTCAHTS